MSEPINAFNDELISAYIDGALSADEQPRVAALLQREFFGGRCAGRAPVHPSGSGSRAAYACAQALYLDRGHGRPG